MHGPRKRWWARPLLGAGFGLALTLTLCVDPEPSADEHPAEASRKADSSLGLGVRHDGPTGSWSIRSASWNKAEDESSRRELDLQAVPAATSWDGLDMGTVAE